MRGKWFGRSVAVILAAGLVGCSEESPDVYVSADVETLYNLGADLLERRRWKGAAAAFNEVERQHPYSAWARRAQLMTAYASYQSNDYDEAILAAQRFLALHPGNASAPYAYYLIALSYYQQVVDVGRDQRITEQASAALLEVMRRFPDTDYARDAQAKFQLTLDQLAGKEMEVGRFYQRRKKYLAAIGRFKSVVERYQTTAHVPEALHRLVESYMALGVEDEAHVYASVLGHNYPDNKWYRYAYSLMTDDRGGDQGDDHSGQYAGLAEGDDDNDTP